MMTGKFSNKSVDNLVPKMSLFTKIVIKRIVLILSFGLATVSSADSGSIQTVDAFKSKYVPARRVDIWLPDEYSPCNRSCYMEHSEKIYGIRARNSPEFDA
jgi:hypothetical protein